MTINFRRNALQLSVAALFSSAFMANAADVPQVKVTVTDKQCEPMTITVNAGKTQFIIQNHSQKALEWEILKGVMVVEERENIAPGFSQKMTANLQPGEYDMTCGLLTNPKGKLIVKGEATADAAQSDALLSLGGAITAYKAYVMAETTQLVTDTKAFTDAIKAGDIEKAKALYAPTRQHYERIEPIAELFSDLDGSIDAREDDYEQKAAAQNSLVSTVWKKHCLATTPPKGWISTLSSFIPMWSICKNASVNWLSLLQKWSAAQPD
ncbi:inactive ferrous ion transporter periplasmic protein EfeO [Escherichia coli]|nr:inactive ferrous ion transporter periplasmic protein EfeO [Escherichia coli]